MQKCQLNVYIVFVQWNSPVGLSGHHATLPGARRQSQEQHLFQTPWTNEPVYPEGTESLFIEVALTKQCHPLT